MLLDGAAVSFAAEAQDDARRVLAHAQEIGRDQTGGTAWNVL